MARMIWFPGIPDAEVINRTLRMAKGQYVTIDLYDGIVEVIYDGNSLKDARYARRERLIDTDGEAYVKILMRE